MAKPVPETVIQQVVVTSQGTTWRCMVLLEDEGPNAGSYIGLAVSEALDTLVTTPSSRVLDALFSVARLVINRDSPIRTPADDVRVSREYARGEGLKNPL